MFGIRDFGIVEIRRGTVALVRFWIFRYLYRVGKWGFAYRILQIELALLGAWKFWNLAFTKMPQNLNHLNAV